MRRVHVNGQTTLMDYCTGPSFASGGFIADSHVRRHRRSTARSSSGSPGTARSTAGPTASGTRCSRASPGAPAQCFPACRRLRPVHDARDQPGDTRGAVPLRRRARATTASSCRPRSATQSGTSWAAGPTPGTSIPIGQFFVAKPGDTAATINNALSPGQNLLFTPGVYHLDQTHQGQARRHGGARTRLRDARPARTASRR